MTTLSLIPIFISSIALIISILAIILNNLIPFDPQITNSSPEFSIYKITPDMSGDENKLTWWIPSFNIGFSMYNLGRRTGKIKDFRIVAEILQDRTTNLLYFYPKWIVDFPKFQQNQTRRFTWISKAVISDWYPVMMFGNKDLKMHLILEGPRWENTFEGIMKLKIEYVSSKKDKWILLDNYELPLSKDMFEDESTYTPFDNSIEKYRKLN